MKNIILTALFLCLPIAGLNAQDFFSNQAQESQQTVQSEGVFKQADASQDIFHNGVPDQGTDFVPGAPINQYVLILGLVGLGLGGFYLVKRRELIKE